MSRAAYKGREVVIYTPSEEEVKVLKAEAKKHGVTLSKYAYEMIQRGRRSSKGVTYTSENGKGDSQLMEENHALQEKLQNVSLQLEKLGRDLKDTQTQARADYAFVPLLFNLFRNDHILSNEAILSSLDLKPNDPKVRSVFKSLDALNEWHLIYINTKGDWTWDKWK